FGFAPSETNFIVPGKRPMSSMSPIIIYNQDTRENLKQILELKYEQKFKNTTGFEGRGPSVWDEFVRKPGKIVDNSTGDVAADSYHKYKEDIALLKKLGVTLYHWDLPLALQDKGGWLNRDTIEHFRKYAKFCFTEFGKKVKIWITINEPMVVATMGHCGKSGEHAPGGLKEHCHWSQYLAGHNLLLAHGHAYRTYHGMNWKPSERGYVGIANSIQWVIPETEADEEITKLARDRTFGWFSHPILKNDYPPLLKERIKLLSKLEGRAESRFPEFTEFEKLMLSGSADFLGINYYVTLITKRLENDQDRKSQSEYRPANLEGTLDDIPAMGYQNRSWMPVGDSTSWIRSYPDGLEGLLDYVRTEYSNPDVIITENGCMDTPNENLNDITRIRYLKGHIAAVSKAMSKGSKIRGYNLWSLIDNFEWADGYTKLFGIHKVDFNDPNRARTSKLSAKIYSEIIQSNQVVIDEDCTWP
ncbi:hypothetical protein WR25_03913, partial [Diploscapter pachys]